MFKLPLAQRFLIGGDLIVITVVTLAGFATHNTLGSAGFRILATFLPLLIAWAVMGYFVGVFQLPRTGAARQLWRPFLAMILAAPWFGLMRAWMLGVDSISALFIVIIGGIGALSMLAWRTIFLFLRRSRFLAESHG